MQNKSLKACLRVYLQLIWKDDVHWPMLAGIG